MYAALKFLTVWSHSSFDTKEEFERAIHFYFGDLVTWRVSEMAPVVSDSQGELQYNSLAIYVRGRKLVEIF